MFPCKLGYVNHQNAQCKMRYIPRKRLQLHSSATHNKRVHPSVLISRNTMWNLHYAIDVEEMPTNTRGCFRCSQLGLLFWCVRSSSDGEAPRNGKTLVNFAYQTMMRYFIGQICFNHRVLAIYAHSSIFEEGGAHICIQGVVDCHVLFIVHFELTHHTTRGHSRTFNSVGYISVVSFC